MEGLVLTLVLLFALVGVYHIGAAQESKDMLESCDNFSQVMIQDIKYECTRAE